MFLLSRRIRGGEDDATAFAAPGGVSPCHSATDTRTQSSRTLDVFAARSPLDGLVFFVTVYLGHVAGRPRGEGRGVRAATVAALLQVSPLSAKTFRMDACSM